MQAREARRAKRKLSPKQVAAQARRETEQAQLRQSIREIYRKLASALHPDRETDPLERERKTALMQRANQAYGKSDLLQLLELQLELEHIDQYSINNISADRLKRYIAILRGQVSELDQELQHVEMRFRHSYGIAPCVDISPDTVLRSIAANIADIRQSVGGMEEDLQVLEDAGQLKSWLKEVKRQHATFIRGDSFDVYFSRDG